MCPSCTWGLRVPLVNSDAHLSTNPTETGRRSSASNPWATSSSQGVGARKFCMLVCLLHEFRFPQYLKPMSPTCYMHRIARYQLFPQNMSQTHVNYMPKVAHFIWSLRPYPKPILLNLVTNTGSRLLVSIYFWYESSAWIHGRYGLHEATAQRGTAKFGRIPKGAGGMNYGTMIWWFPSIGVP